MALQSKHDFSMTSFGMLCGLLFDGLRELTIMRCSDFFDAESGGLETIAALPSLEALRIEDMNCLHRPESLAKLSKLTQVRAIIQAFEPLRRCLPKQSYGIRS